MDDEKKVSRFIDSLNAEKKPARTDSSETEELMHTARLVRTLREPAMPGKDFPGKLSAEVAGRLARKKLSSKPERKWIAGLAGAAAAAAVLLVFFSLPLGGGSVVYAMQRAYQEVKAYHGELTVTETNGKGEVSMQSKLEVWADKEGRYYIEELEGAQKGLVTVNNGQKKWQIHPDTKEVTIHPAFPDTYRFILELGREVDNAGNALEVKTMGDEMISGRSCTVLQVTPKGGEPYRIWIDKETKLPLQKQSGITSTVPYQYTATYTGIEFTDEIPAEKMDYGIPKGFTELVMEQEQWVNTLSEAQDAAGFAPKDPGIPQGYERYGIAVQSGNTVKLYYESTDKTHKAVVMQRNAPGEFRPDVNAVQGKIGESTAEILSPVQDSQGILGGVDPYAGSSGINSIRWQAGEMEYTVAGNIPVDQLAVFITALTAQTIVLPGKTESMEYRMEVPVDMEAEQNEQKSVDAGHSPWKLDPAFVAQVFVSLKISPEGITGDYPIPYEDFKVTQNSGTEAVVEVLGGKTPVSRVYLKRLVRQDSTGIWTVVGYDPA